MLAKFTSAHVVFGYVTKIEKMNPFLDGLNNYGRLSMKDGTNRYLKDGEIRESKNSGPSAILT